jgi:hypothetical protein
MRVALLSFHAHGDRSFLDDRELALVSGDLRDGGVENDLVVAVVPRGEDREIEPKLAAVLGEYDPIVYERVFSLATIERLRAALPGRTFVACDGEHSHLRPPADHHVRGDLREAIPALLASLRGAPAPPRRDTWRPNLAPRVVNPEALPAFRTFSIDGNAGCPYQADARQSPLYAGADIPAGIGRGCAFCTTGNRFEGAPASVIAERVIERIRWVRAEAPQLRHLVLKDQNPFAWLERVVEQIASESLGPLTLMLETRVDWCLRNRSRLERALATAKESGNRICPYLIGIESFSQAELDRFNKGITAEENAVFVETLWKWKEAWGDALDLEHCAFGYVLFSPWTTLADLRASHAGIVRTRFDRLRGALCLSRARLYPDTALYYLAARDGLLCETWEHAGDDSSLRYGYYPGTPWRFADARVASLASLAREVSERTRARDQVALLGALLDAFEAGRERELEVDALARAVEGGTLAAVSGSASRSR